MLTDIKKEEKCFFLKIFYGVFKIVAFISVLPGAILGKKRPEKIKKSKTTIFYTRW